MFIRYVTALKPLQILTLREIELNMALTNKERQARYRERKRLERLEQKEKPENINIKPPDSSHALIHLPESVVTTIKRIASFKGISEVDLLTRLINEAETDLLRDIWSDPEAKKRYFGW